MIEGLLDWQHLSFAHPYFFLLLLLLPLMIWLRWKRRRTDHPAIRMTSLAVLTQHRSWKVQLRPVLFLLRLITVAALVIALARPQSSNVTETIDSEGVDIMLAMDVSGSMLAEDLKPNRLEAAKRLAMDFVDQRPTDRMGLVIFSGEAFTQCPVTIDHSVLKQQLSQVESGMLEDGTAIGDGLATAVDRTRTSKSKSKIIILLTDGVNNRGKIGPETALEIARAFRIKVYTIGIGTKGEAPQPVPTQFGMRKMMVKVEIDEPLMRKIAAQTGGRYYRATSNASLAAIYKEIDQLEKSSVEINSFKRYAELFFPFALVALCALALELLLRYTVFRSVT